MRNPSTIRTSTLGFASLAALALGVSACGGPTPEKVCDHVYEIIKKDMSKDDASDEEKEMAKGFLDGFKEMCLVETKKEQEKDKAKFDKLANCSLAASTMEALDKCRDDNK